MDRTFIVCSPINPNIKIGIAMAPNIKEAMKIAKIKVYCPILIDSEHVDQTTLSVYGQVICKIERLERLHRTAERIRLQDEKNPIFRNESIDEARKMTIAHFKKELVND